MSKASHEIDVDGETLWPANSAAVRWSFGLGFALLVVLVIISHLAVN